MNSWLDFIIEENWEEINWRNWELNFKWLLLKTGSKKLKVIEESLLFEAWR
jgi:hypothetical protein